MLLKQNVITLLLYACDCNYNPDTRANKKRRLEVKRRRTLKLPVTKLHVLHGMGVF